MKKSNKRIELKKIGKTERHRFTAEYGTVGYKQQYGHFLPTLMLKNVKYNNKLVTDHIWFNYTKGFCMLGKLKAGDFISFDTRVNTYQKGYFPIKDYDYDLERPTKINLDNRNANPSSIPDVSNNKNALVGFIMQTNKDFYLKNGRPYEPWYVEQYKNWLKNN